MNFSGIWNDFFGRSRMSIVTVVFPHQLYREHPAIDDGVPVYLVEEGLFFRQYRFHRQKLVFHRASMKFYEQWLREKGHQVTYVSAESEECDCRKLLPMLGQRGVTEIRMAEVIDDWLERRMAAACKKQHIALKVSRTPNFLTAWKNAADFFDHHKRYFQTDFYVWQRRRWKILVDGKVQPIGGRWSFDDANRKRFPKDKLPVSLAFRQTNPFVAEAETYVSKVFPDAYAGDGSKLLFGVTYDEADIWLDEFLQKRFHEFGEYEDAIVGKESLLYHSGLSPMINVGLLSPAVVVKRALEFATAGKVPINSLEGFVRQLIGWREFVRVLYVREGRRQRTTNFWNFDRKIPARFWTGETGIAPVDIVIGKVLKYGYCHHMERLMVLGNFMLLCEFDPDEVYRWFMEMFIDAYDWVMVPNIYGMSQFADGGLMITKPYISGSNYLLKMGDFPRGEWQEIWDGLFWRFLAVRRNFFKRNQRLGMLVDTFDKMPAEKRNMHLDRAESFLRSLGR